MIHCFEPSSLNYQLLTQAHKHFLGNHSQGEQQRLQVHCLAFSNTTGTTHFSANCETELCHILSGGCDVVNVTTVDVRIQQLGLHELFLLKIDTEGFDPLVLKGAQATLAAHKVTLLQFEYHGINMWKSHSLESVTEWLDTLSYTCYYDGPLLTQITGCWSPELDIKA